MCWRALQVQGTRGQQPKAVRTRGPQSHVTFMICCTLMALGRSSAHSRIAHPRPTLMVHAHGARPWCTPMVHTHGARSWCTLMVHAHGARSWCTPMVHTHGARPWCKPPANLKMRAFGSSWCAQPLPRHVHSALLRAVLRQL